MSLPLDPSTRLARAALAACAVALSALALAQAPLRDAASLAPPVLVAAVLLAGGLLLRGLPTRGRVRLVVLADVLAVAALLATLPHDEAGLRRAGLAAYGVGVVLALAGRRRLAGLAAGAAGVLVGMLLAGPGWQAATGSAHGLALLGARMLAVVLAAMEVAWAGATLAAVAAGTGTDEAAARAREPLETRPEALLQMAQALVQAEAAPQVQDALLAHVRRQASVQACAVALEGEGEVLAAWEERGRLEEGQRAPRLARLQQAWREAGLEGTPSRLALRSLQPTPAAADPAWATWVVLPLRALGSTHGVLVLADTRREAVPAPAAAALGDAARRAAEALARIARARDEEARRTALLLRQMHEGVVLLGPEGQALLANPAAREALGMGHEGLVLPDRMGDVAVADLARTAPGVAQHFRMQVARGAGQRPLDMAGTAVAIVEGRKRVGTLLTLRDVSGEEQARRRLMEAEKMTLVGQTLAGVAHELNNPLAALVGYADLLEQADVPAQLRRPVQQMREQAIRATRIVRNLLNFARRRNPQRAAVSIPDLVQGTLDLFAYEARMQQVAVEQDLAPALPPLLGDPHALQQVLVNLVQNALHALATSTRTPRRLRVRAVRVGEDLHLSVADNGPGVPREVVARLFEPFFTTKAAGHGTGLGLALSRSVAREHGGELLLEGGPGEGACFVVRLPIKPVAATGPAGADPGSGRLPASLLVVDDEAAVRETAVAQAGLLGIKAQSACDVEEATRALARGGFEVLLVDVRMPGASGLDLLDSLRTRDPGLARRLVLMTGDVVNDDVLARLRASGNPWMEKPFTTHELRTALCAAVRAGELAGGTPAPWRT